MHAWGEFSRHLHVLALDLTSFDDCSTRNVRVWTTCYDLAIHLFVDSHRYLSLWPVKNSEIYAIVIYAAKDDQTIIYVIKYRKNQMKIEQLNHHCYVEKNVEQNTTKFVQINVEQKSLKLIACRINVLNIRNATRSMSKYFSNDEKCRHIIYALSPTYTRDWTASFQHVFDNCSRL